MQAYVSYPASSLTVDVSPAARAATSPFARQGGHVVRGYAVTRDLGSRYICMHHVLPPGRNVLRLRPSKSPSIRRYAPRPVANSCPLQRSGCSRARVEDGIGDKRSIRLLDPRPTFPIRLQLPFGQSMLDRRPSWCGAEVRCRGLYRSLRLGACRYAIPAGNLCLWGSLLQLAWTCLSGICKYATKAAFGISP
jgi:hypothetical protein